MYNLEHLINEKYYGDFLKMVDYMKFAIWLPTLQNKYELGKFV